MSVATACEAQNLTFQQLGCGIDLAAIQAPMKSVLISLVLGKLDRLWDTAGVSSFESRCQLSLWHLSRLAARLRGCLGKVLAAPVVKKLFDKGSSAPCMPTSQFFRNQ
jgi:hypothetical protein